MSAGRTNISPAVSLQRNRDSPTRDRNLLKIAFKIAISAALIAWLVYGIDGSALADGLSQVSFPALFLAFAILLGLSAVQACRWVFVARAMEVGLPFRTAWVIVLIGLFFNQTLPSSIGGDAARVWRLRRAGVPVGLSIRTVLLDRLVALLALLVIATAGLPALMGWIGDQPLRWAVPILLFAGFSGFAALLLIDTPVLRKVVRMLRTEEIVALGRSAHQVFLNPRRLLSTLAISLFIHATVCVSITVIGLDIGADITFWQMLVLFPPVLLLSMVPFSVAGWGIREGAMITALGFIGVPPAIAFSISILFGFVILAVGLTGGVVWLASGGQRPKADTTIDQPPTFP